MVNKNSTAQEFIDEIREDIRERGRKNRASVISDAEWKAIGQRIDNDILKETKEQLRQHEKKLDD